MELVYTQKKRFIDAANKRIVDRPPCICPGGMMNMMFEDIMDYSGCLWPNAHLDAKIMAKLAIALNQAGGFENYGVPFCMTVEAESMGAKVNIGNKLCEPHVVESPLQSCSQFKELKMMDLEIGRAKSILDAISILYKQETDVPIVGNLTGPISIAGTLMDMSTLLKELHKSPETAKQYLDFICRNLIAFGKAQIMAGADAICISEPSGTGEILGPRFFAEYTVKCINSVLDALTVPVKIVHICGELRSVYDILPQIHCDVFSFDAIVPIAEIKKHLTNKAVMGNVNTFALGTMPPEKIKILVKNVLAKGVDIVSPACGLPTNTPLTNVKAMVETVKTI